MTRKQIADIIWTRFNQGQDDWIKCDVAAGWILAAFDDEKRNAPVAADAVMAEPPREGEDKGEK